MKTDEELAQEIMELKTHIDKEDFLIYGSNSGEFQNLRHDAKRERMCALVDKRAQLVTLLNEQYRRTKTL